MKKSVLLNWLALVSIFLIQSCSSENYTSRSGVNLEAKKTATKEVQNITGHPKLSTLSKSEYLAMSEEDQKKFKEEYLMAFRSGGSCSCSTTDGNGGSSSCEVDCPSGTKPKCQDLGGRCDCSCEPYGDGGINQKYEIVKNTDKSRTLINKNKPELLTAFLNSDLPNVKKIGDLFIQEPVFEREINGQLRLSEKEFIQLESKFQVLMKDYTIEQYFKFEYEL